MSLYQNIVDTRKKAMKDRNTVVKSILDPLLGDIQLAQSQAQYKNKSIDVISAAIVKMFFDKINEYLAIESIDADRRAALENERAVLEQFREKQLSAEEMLDEITQTFGETIEAKQKGLVFKHFVTKFPNRYDGAVLGDVIKHLTV